jgi:GNAT superfamily N-acetyltransferase
MIKLIRTNSQNPDFINLVKELDTDLAIRDGEDHAFYDQYNKIDLIKHVVVAYSNGAPVGCGAIKQYSHDITEVKRMFTNPGFRGNGIASAVLRELEKWAEESGFSKCILETGKKQPEAIALYRKNNYTCIPNYGQYKDVEESVCFEKLLHKPF